MAGQSRRAGTSFHPASLAWIARRQAFCDRRLTVARRASEVKSLLLPRLRVGLRYSGARSRLDRAWNDDSGGWVSLASGSAAPPPSATIAALSATTSAVRPTVGLSSWHLPR